MLDNVSSRSIEKYLFDEYGERISYGTINNFKNNNVDIAELIQQVELQQRTIKDGKVNLFNDKIQENEKAEQMIIKEINQGIDVLNLIRGGLSIANDKNLFEEFFESKDVSLKDKMQVMIQLSKLDLDWRKQRISCYYKWR